MVGTYNTYFRNIKRKGKVSFYHSATKGFSAQKYKDQHKEQNTTEIDHDTIAGEKAAEIACKYIHWLLSTVNPNPCTR